MPSPRIDGESFQLAWNGALGMRMRAEIAWLGRLCERALEMAEHETQRGRPGRAHRHRQLAASYSEHAFEMAMLLPLRGRA